jgi:hypothetical protein
MTVAQGGLIWLWDGGAPAPPAVVTSYVYAMPIGPDPPYDGGWVPLADHLMAFEVTRGRPDALSGIVGGTLQVALDNDDGAFDPQNSASLWYPNVRIRQVLRLQAVRDGITYPLSLCYLDTNAGEPLALGANANLVGTDFFAQLQDQPLTGTFPAQLEGARINAILDAIGFTGGRQISDGVLTLPAASFVEANLLQHIDAICKAGRGTFFLGMDGSAIFRDRHWRLLQSSIGSFGAQGTYPIPTPAPELSRDGLYNRVRVRRSASGVNAVQALTCTGSPPHVWFTLTYEGATTRQLFGGAPISALQAQLEALTTIGPSNVTVSGGPFPTFPVYLNFQGTLAMRPLSPVVVGDVIFDPGISATLTVSTIQAGVDPTRTAEDLTSQGKYGILDYSLDQTAADLLASDEDAQLWANWFLGQHQEPRATIKTIDVDPTINPALWPRVLEADLDQHFTLAHDLPGTKGIVSDPYYIEGVKQSFKAGDAAGLQVQWAVSLAEAQLGHFFILDSACSLEVDTWLSY